MITNNFLKLNLFNKNKITSPRLSRINLTKLTTAGYGLNSKLLALGGFKSSARIKGFLILLNKRENSIKSLLLLKNKKLLLWKKTYYQRWSYLFNSKFYKGLRFAKGLPVRGQRTHTNASTARKFNLLRP